MPSKDIEHYGIIAVWFIWCIALLLISLRGRSWLRKRSERRTDPYLGKYEKLVSYWMLFIAVGLGCMMALVLLTIFSD
jgi:uncharacterized iron-regulated membrane protein